MSPWFCSPLAQRLEVLSRANDALSAKPPARLDLMAAIPSERETGHGTTHVVTYHYASGRAVETFFTRDAVLVEREVA